MDWLRSVVLTFMVALLGAACAPLPGNPREFWVDSRFEASDVEDIMRGAEKWNAAGREYIGHDLIKISGLYSDPDGLDFNSDLNDGRNVIYRNDDNENDDLRHYLQAMSGINCLCAYTFGEDIIMNRAYIVARQNAEWRAAFRTILFHELGHALGLPHSPLIASIMYVPYDYLDDHENLDRSDLLNLCEIYDCTKKP